ncbi:hypothetical protein LJC42_02640, partial [Eubacteriales bacterium OttesenSCG-928-K08]|nr:hypothetical protein [Eubacteriales bacterium OttesenSCG-928-K08]
SLLRAAGSDVHIKEDYARAWIETDQPIKSARDYYDALKSGNYRMRSVDKNDAGIIEQAQL